MLLWHFNLPKGYSFGLGKAFLKPRGKLLESFTSNKKIPQKKEEKIVVFKNSLKGLNAKKYYLFVLC